MPTDPKHDKGASLLPPRLERAMTAHASDWHLDRTQEGWQVKSRIEGQLQHWEKLDVALGSRLLSCLKVKAQLDMTEHRRPQEGRFHVYHQHHLVHCRVTTCPTFWGEKASIRFLYGMPTQRALSELGMDTAQQQIVQQTLQLHHGMLLVCGPTGSGKSHTLSAMLQHLQQAGRYILTIEDPVEIPLPGVNHIQTQPALGLDDAQALKTCLRMDPDVIMIGEIRDTDTAQLAWQAAQTGHLILGTVHSHDAAGVFERMAALGVTQPALSKQLHLIINQRLIALLCPECKQPHPSLIHGYQAVGCKACHRGYAGRRALFECWQPPWPPNATLRDGDPIPQQAKALWVQGACSNDQVMSMSKTCPKTYLK